MLAAQTAAPIYGPFDTFVGTGAVGGYMPSFATIGQRAGQIVGALLDGASPSARSLLEPIPTALNVDWRQVRRLGIDEKAIPGDAIVRFREPSAWEEYRNEIVITIVALVVQAQLIVWLLVERRRRRKAQHAEQGLRTELAHGARLAMAGELIGSIAHEINQPLGAILSNADTGDHILESDADPRAEMRAILSDIRRDDLRASEVILRLRKLLSKHEVERRPLDVNHAALDVEPILRAEAKRRGVALAIESAPEAAMIVGDRIQIQQVLINLVLERDGRRAGAARRSSPGRAIHCRKRKLPLPSRFAIGGTASRPRIFRRSSSRSSRPSRTVWGWGSRSRAASSRRTADESAAENRSPGALFQVDLPAARNGSRGHSGFRMSAAPVIHVVDDDESMRNALLRALRSAGFEARGYASTGEFLLHPPPDHHGCMLIDVRMPGPSGLDLQDALRRQGLALPVVFLTGHATVSASVRAMKAGAVDFLAKPVKREVLLDALKRALARDAQRRTVRDDADRLRAGFATLSAREREVFDGVAAGKSNKQIADELGIAERTVKVHRAAAMTKLNAESAAEVGRLAQRLQDLPPASEHSSHED